ncbi:metallophosphoesterase [Candidatus Gastranaerophilus sp. (ex Termes propinquus)]|nr:metallophosphoesterase [Candidatus Gastranaerophilus sp. (ex Termes propinquus)]
MSKEFKILFFSDVVGRAGRRALKNFLEEKKQEFSDYFVIANVENASHGFGLTKKNHDEFIECGVHCMTSGNHIWDKKDIFSYINESNVLIRPLNYLKDAPGVGYRVFDDKLIVANLMGKTFMQPARCPFAAFDELMGELRERFNEELSRKIIFIDFHAEASAEKACFVRYAQSFGASAVLGTHTHVQTADECIIKGEKDCAFVTDVGFCGAKGGIIGMDYEISLRRLLTAIPERFDPIESEYSQINACKVVFDYETGAAKSIERIDFTIKHTDKEEDKMPLGGTCEN